MLTHPTVFALCPHHVPFSYAHLCQFLQKVGKPHAPSECKAFACNGLSYVPAQVNCCCYLSLSLYQHSITLMPRPDTSLIHPIGILFPH